jgi:arylsulfatase A-like enzyme
MRSLSTDSTAGRGRRKVALATMAALLAAALGLSIATHEARGAPAANVIFILTDDQATSELSSMPATQALIGGEGITFTNAYISYPLCCPSRATLLSGQYMHNHGVRGNSGAFGGWQRFRPHESDTIATRMHDAGYYNVHIGKYLNGYAAGPSFPLPVPAGWDQWYGKVSEAPLYFNYSLIEKTGPANTPDLAFYGDQPSEYQTDVFSDKAVGFIDDLSGSETPFMMNVWFNAPHGPFEPAPRHLFALSNTVLPRVPGFDEKNMSDKPKWLQKQAKKRLSKSLKGTIASERRRRLEQLISVDEGVKAIVDKLDDQGILDDTYIIFMSDNGFFRGEHRIAGGKYLPYDPSSKVPLMIRGPGITHGTSSDELVSNLDIPQTIEDIATGSPDPEADGRSLLPFAQDATLRSTRPVLLEADTGPGKGNDGFDPQEASAGGAKVARAGIGGARGVKNLDQETMGTKSVANGNFAPAYKAIRTDRYLYVLYANGQTELYDLHRDPAELRSKSHDRRYRWVRRFLFSKLVDLATCKAAVCRGEIGADPAPVPKKKKKKKKRKKKKKKGGPKPRR